MLEVFEENLEVGLTVVVAYRGALVLSCVVTKEDIAVEKITSEGPDTDVYLELTALDAGYKVRSC